MIRLTRRPSLWITFVARVAYTAGCSAAVIAAWRYAPRLPWMLFGVSGIIVFAALCGIVMSWRDMTAGVPIVKIDHSSLAYGESAKVLVLEPRPGPVAEMGVKLIGECPVSSATDISNFRDTRVSVTRCYEEELLGLRPRSDEPLSRVVQIHIPKSPPADATAWKIVVAAHLKQGGVVEHPFPLRVS